MLKPLADSRWGHPAAAHLLNRAGFGGTPPEIESLAAMGLEQAVSHLVDYEKTPDPTPDPEWAKPDPARAQRFLQARRATAEVRRQLQREEQQQQRQRIVELRHWWLQRMAYGPRPLQEKLVLFWHGHFATSVEKVRDAYLMWRQNELFRRLAAGSWQQLLVEAGQDPAMLIWLDQAQSRKERPNENFAREVMELFALGEGHYTEKDIAEGARALTGWSYDRLTQRFVVRPNWRDEGEKVIFGKNGNFDGDDFIRLIVEQPEAATFITGKLWQFFSGSPPSTDVAKSLAGVFRASGNQFKPVLRAMFLSEAFYAPDLVRSQVKSPVQWLVGSVRLLERPLPPAAVCTGLTRTLGQDLFAPPNVKGWDGGLSWITTNNLLTRYNQAAMLVQGDLSAAQGMMAGRKGGLPREREVRNLKLAGIDCGKLFTEEERRDKERLLSALEQRFLGAPLKRSQQEALRIFLSSQSPLDDEDVRNAIRLVMSTPEYQLA